MRRFRTTSLASVAVVALVLAACGGSDDADGSGGGLSAEDRALADAISADLVDGDEDGFAAVFDTDCMGEQMVRALGGAAAIERDYGVTADNIGDVEDRDFTEDDAQKIAEGYVACGSMKELFTLAFVQEGGVTQEQADCLVADIEESAFEAAIAEVLAGVDDGPASGDVFNAMVGRIPDCGIEP
ncbi:MAG: hypothetical protein AAFP84_13990 [Actinomycetota bacterium]